ncbi:Bug family tripartite tricarboxylate transporter substrate binding protein [Bauldia sp.]|uniref:Bug family tripartite tricarboxylate transporter substrate binding protein n=1 Tax=Bauldia sp. TaxID=2575872 RepID=UPI003BAD0DFE
MIVYQTRRHILAAGLLAAATATSGITPANADVDFSGKTVTIVVGYGAGGGYDTFGRLAADHLGRFLPGSPSVIVENMPGGGGRRSIGFLAEAAPTDGTVIAVIPATVVFDSVVGNLPEGVTADDFTFIGRLGTSVVGVATWHTAETKSVEDAKQRATTLAATGRTANSSIIPRALNVVAGTQFEVVEGYKGTAEIVLAFERGEVEGGQVNMSIMERTHPDWYPDKKINLLWQVSLERSDAYPEVPALVEFAENKDGAAVLSLLSASGSIGRSLAGPPGMADETLDIYRTAFEQMLRDPDYLEDADRRNIPTDSLSGEELAGIIVSVLEAPTEVVDVLTEIVKSDD